MTDPRGDVMGASGSGACGEIEADVGDGIGIYSMPDGSVLAEL